MMSGTTRRFRDRQVTAAIGWWFRCVADRIDPAGAPRAISWSFTFERGEGVRFRQDQRGCLLWYLGRDAYERAHLDADKPV